MVVSFLHLTSNPPACLSKVSGSCAAALRDAACALRLWRVQPSGWALVVFFSRRNWRNHWFDQVILEVNLIQFVKSRVFFAIAFADRSQHRWKQANIFGGAVQDPSASFFRTATFLDFNSGFTKMPKLLKCTCKMLVSICFYQFHSSSTQNKYYNWFHLGVWYPKCL